MKLFLLLAVSVPGILFQCYGWTVVAERGLRQEDSWLAMNAVLLVALLALIYIYGA